MAEITALDISIDDFTDEERSTANRSGVDLTLLVSNLRLTPEERLRRHARALHMALMLRSGMTGHHQAELNVR